MPSHGPPSPNPQPGTKRQRQESYDGSSPQNGQPSPTEQQGDALAGLGGAGASSKAGQSSNFRNVSACNRCRLRKNRCDQKLPSCASCAKAGVACVGYDPITKKEIPRSYVFYLETRVEQLEKLLNANNISFPPAENLELCSRPGVDASSTLSGGDSTYSGRSEIGERAKSHSQVLETLKAKKAGQSPAMLNIVSPSKPRSLASASGVSFARVVFAAVQYSVSDSNTAGDRSGGRSLTGNATSMRDSFFGLHAKPTIQPAPFPAKEVGLRLVHLYFEHANPQIPILHRGEFMKVFNHAYETGGQDLAPRELYLLNMVFAIGCGVIVGEPVKTEASDGDKMAIDEGKGQSQPEEYHASAIVHLESCLSFSAGGLEVLQAVLLLANFALLRPVPPGLWYITGVAVRLAVDLGLHHEDGTDVEGMPPDPSSEMDTTDGDTSARGNGSQERGRRLWVRDMRRRLWWCTYSFDRLVSTCVGRPFGISDQVITTELPSLLDDEYITPSGFLEPPEDDDRPSYKHVAHHYFRLRMLQSEILQVLQYNQAQLARVGGNQGKQYPEMHTHLPSPFLVQFDSFRSWRIDIDRRLYQWKANAPTRSETGVAFSTEFLELNYWQAIIMLYRQSLSVPAMFEGEYNTSDEVNSPTAFTAELREDEDRIYLKVAEAGQKILRIYRQLHLSGLVSYTYLSTHHLFMAGISYLYAIWHSPVVRSRLSMDEVDFTVLAAKSVFTDMIDKCPPAETCRDAFDRTAKATIKMASSSGGFGPASQQPRRQRRETVNWASAPDAATLKPPSRRPNQSEQAPFQFDLSISDNLSSPSLSATGEMHTPPLGKSKTFETDTFISGSRSQSGPSPGNRTISHDGGSSIDPSLVPSPPVSRRTGNQHGGSGGTFMGQQFGMQGSMDYPDAQTMEFLQNLGATPNGDMNNMEQAQLDLGFGINWEGMHNDYGEGQQINPFDTFFFGGQQTGGGGGGGGGNGGGAAGSGGNNGNGAA
ncbi:positive regulator of purine utilization [Purpureocillium lilacinum]|uniref:Positive regulator of purine utilization n=1 Tax=Purpureocillium lilacinum TaxID=33203 RepID=A0A179HWU9_PURLI|nr:positive regulator of purine utilization [Purpureocillium lilacinum]KAK4087496.1 transcriptional regulator family: Fungal Specific TF [Purpureocillium lilacinum]OAQ86892.1 positive regulator of purine utilization [Purpureocillium lilacinum]OAQ94857.1 positive regulator of purine utilization [Purpureocillium lilacinum]PWI70297.1 positive regulator of purine utilization [Purpureocillium lilacinum]GJN66875.1 fungal specific transcription factor [Purpureocillium lilacinum]